MSGSRRLVVVTLGAVTLCAVTLGAVTLGAAGPDQNPHRQPGRAPGGSLRRVDPRVDPHMTVLKPPVAGRTRVIEPPGAAHRTPDGTIIVPR